MYIFCMSFGIQCTGSVSYQNAYARKRLISHDCVFGDLIAPYPSES
jgi:hypothetical protein